MVKAGASLAASLACGLVMLLAVPSAQAQTLEDALVAAYTGNPTLQAERAKLRQTDELVPQAKAGWKPTVAVEAGAGVDWIRRTFHDNIPRDTSDHTNNPVSASINLSQPVYRGGSTAAELRQADNTVLAERAQLAVVEEQILLQAITAYVDVVRDMAVVDLTKNNQQVIGQQLKATKERFDVGEVTKTDVSQAEARLAGAVADVVQAQGNLTASRATYKQVIGDMPGKLTRPPVPTNLPSGSDETVALSENNPAVLAAILLEKAARDGTDVVFGELLPRMSRSWGASRSTMTCRGTT
jgi:outer membrane protein